jgi:WD40 repeat protein
VLQHPDAGRIELVKPHPDGHTVVTTSRSGPIAVWDLQQTCPVRRVQAKKDVRLLAFSDDGGSIATIGVGGEIAYHSLRDGIASVYLSPRRPPSMELPVLPTFYGGGDQWRCDWSTLRSALHWGGDMNDVVGVCSDGRTIMSVTPHHDVQIWDAPTQRLMCRNRLPLQQRICLRLSADGRRALAVMDGGRIQLLDTATLKPYADLHATTSSVICAEFSPNGQLIATGEGSTLIVWDGETLTRRCSLEGHTALVRCATFSPDCKRLVTGGEDGTVRIWDLSTSEQLLCLQEHSGSVVCTTFSRDGRALATLGDDGQIIVWRLP